MKSLQNASNCCQPPVETTTNPGVIPILLRKLSEQRSELVRTLDEAGEAGNAAADLVRLLRDVDRALKRLGTDEFGRCAVCGERMYDEEMLESPLREYCLCELSPNQQAALQRDLDLAWRIQASLLPQPNLQFAGWQMHYRYLPAGPVSGDYCDAITHTSEGGWLYFLVGDVSGKGVAASYVMAHLSALVRRTLDDPVPVAELMATVDRHLVERMPECHFITLVSGRAHRDGRIEFCNAGHCLPIVLGDSATRQLDSTAMPLGIVAQSEYQTLTTTLAAGDSLVIYSDGITEARDSDERMYGTAALEQTAWTHRSLAPSRLAVACLKDLREFQNGAPQSDDITLMVLRRLDGKS